ncbi:MAG TPA: 6,7-dimethyl-8-ribityllumazine synthase [Acidimicrobiales bacterium]|nr:6,7-dimethyl-8-ribityllumazine synthase [Acidimicrobiales bacterium]
MTSSDQTELPEDTIATVATQVGRTAVGAHHAAGVRVGLACARFNGGITERLLTGALAALDTQGGDRADVTVAWAPGAFELPLVARALAPSVDAVVCLGAVIRGDTGHYDFVAGECAAGMQRVQLDTGTPVVFGVLTTETVEQALVRSEPDETNKGREAVLAAIEMVSLLTELELHAPGGLSALGVLVEPGD